MGYWSGRITRKIEKERKRKNKGKKKEEDAKNQY